MHARAEFAAEPRSAGEARRFVLRAAAGWGLSDADGRIALLVSELVTNAIRHGGGATVALRVSYDGALLRVAVRDTAAERPPRPRRPRARSATGRGLRLVDALADDWGVEPAPGGKAVWFSLAAAQAGRGREPVT